jgi:hypothetical protein
VSPQDFAALPNRADLPNWAERATGIRIEDGGSSIGVPVTQLVRLGLRDNPRRLHLLVSSVLGKHVPTDPRVVLGSGRLLGAIVDDALSSGAPDGDGPDSTLARAGAALAIALGPADTSAPSGIDASAPFGIDAGGPDAAVAFDAAVAEALAVRRDRPRTPSAVLGFAETATALGHCVSDALPGCRYLHSTRRVVPGMTPLAGFAEEHSHAPDHLLLPDDPRFLAPSTFDEALVLVDDELSTGRTAANTIAALHAQAPRQRYIVAALVDVRAAVDVRPAVGPDPLADLAQELGISIEVVSLSRGAVFVPDDARARLSAASRPSMDGHPSADARPALDVPVPAADPAPVLRIEAAATAVRESGRHGVRAGDRAALNALVESLADRLAPSLQGPTLIVGAEELMYAPLMIAARLARFGAPGPVRFSTTTRSPALPIDVADYPIRTALGFRAIDAADVLASDTDDPLARYAYNVGSPEWPRDPSTGSAARTGTIVLVIDDPCDTPELAGLLAQLQARADQVALVVLPAFRPLGADGTPALPEPLRGPAFGSYAGDEATWLLTDLSDVVLEAPTEEREEAVQSGGRHYAESLPIEYRPTEAYQEAFEVALASSADAVAQAVGVVAGLIGDARGDDPVLVSLARAGTPVGILLRRWWAHEGRPAPQHYAISIVRGRGIDDTALRWLAANHDPAKVVFVDGWTGKGAIVRELSDALEAHGARTGVRFDPGIAVLADPAGCVSMYGTREDVLIPSAALNSTVSGLVSRTVLNTSLLSPGTFHGAKFYRQLSDVDVSGRFLDTISDRFVAVAPAVRTALASARASDRSPTWVGWAAVEAISASYGINDVNLVKPGIGETTRVLLRRVPWRVLVGVPAGGAGSPASDDGALAHVLMLARDRGVPIEEVPGLPYRCIGLIHPRYTRGATGAAGVSTLAGARR